MPALAQADRLAVLLADDPGLADGFDLLAFGSGGLLARAYAQRAPAPSAPRVNTLITYNTPHGGTRPTLQTAHIMRTLGGPHAAATRAALAAAGSFRDASHPPPPGTPPSFLDCLDSPGGGEPGEPTDCGAAAVRLAGLRRLVLVLAPNDAPPNPPASAWFETTEPPAEEATSPPSPELLGDASNGGGVSTPRGGGGDAVLDSGGGGGGGSKTVPLRLAAAYKRLGLDRLDRAGRLRLVMASACVRCARPAATRKATAVRRASGGRWFGTAVGFRARGLACSLAAAR